MNVYGHVVNTYKQIDGYLSFKGYSLVQKANLNAFAYLVEYVIRFAVGLALTPLLLSGLGDFYFGVWQLLNRLTSYLSVASGNPTQALKWSLANQQGSADYLKKRGLIGSSIVTWFVFFPLLCLIGGIVTWYVPYIFNLPSDAYISVRIATGILVLNLILFNLAEIPNAILRGENLGYLRLGLSALLALFGGALVITALYFELGLVGVAAATIFVTLLNGFLFYLVVKRHIDWFGIVFPKFSTIKGYIKLSGWYMVWSFVVQMSMTGDVILLGVFSTPELVTTYTITKYVPQMVVTMVVIVVAAITPGLGGIIGQNQLDRARAVRNELMTLSWLILTVSGSLFLLCNRGFVALWIGKDYFAGNLPMLLIVIMVIQYVLYSNDTKILDLFLAARTKTVLGLVALILSTVGAYLSLKVYSFGIVGVCLSFIAGHLVLSIGAPVLVGRFLKTSYRFVSPTILRQCLVMFVLFAISYYVGANMETINFLSLAGITALGMFLFSIIAVAVGLNQSQRSLLFMRMQQILPQK